VTWGVGRGACGCFALCSDSTTCFPSAPRAHCNVGPPTAALSPPPSPLSLPQAYYRALHTGLHHRSPPADVCAAHQALAAVASDRTQLPGLLSYLAVYYKVCGGGVWGVGCGVWGVGCGVWGAGVGVGVGVIPCTAHHRHPRRAACPPPPFPSRLQYEEVLRTYHCSVRAAKARTWADTRRRSVLDQMVHQLTDGDPTAVVVVGGGYLGARAGRGSKVTPVLQTLIRHIARTHVVVVVDEVGKRPSRPPPPFPPSPCIPRPPITLPPAPHAPPPRPYSVQYLTSKVCSKHHVRMTQTSSRGFTCAACGDEVNR
jgi:hypothetical protein